MHWYDLLRQLFPVFDANKTYSIGAEVVGKASSGEYGIWKKTLTIGDESLDSGSWRIVFRPPTREWEAGIKIKKNEVVFYNGGYFKALEDTLKVLPIDSDKYVRWPQAEDLLGSSLVTEEALGIALSNYARITHDHKLLYEPVIANKKTAFNADFGTANDEVAVGDHGHAGTYEPVIPVKNTAFNVNFGDSAGEVVEGDNYRVARPTATGVEHSFDATGLLEDEVRDLKITFGGLPGIVLYGIADGLGDFKEFGFKGQGQNHAESTIAFSSGSDTIGAREFWMNGDVAVYDAAIALTQANLTQDTLRGSSFGYVHCVLSGPGTRNGVSGSVVLKVTGNSFDLATGTYTPGDEEIIMADITTGVLDQVVVSTKLWGSDTPVSVTLDAAGSDATTYALTFNLFVGRFCTPEQYKNNCYIRTGAITIMVDNADTTAEVVLIEKNLSALTYTPTGFDLFQMEFWRMSDDPRVATFLDGKRARICLENINRDVSNGFLIYASVGAGTKHASFQMDLVMRGAS